MNENFAFFGDAVQEILDHGSDRDLDFIGKDQLCDEIKGLTLSTAYSGVGAPEATTLVIRHIVQDLCGCELPAIRILHQVEIDEHCRLELKKYSSLTGHEACCFGDLCDFFVPQLQEIVAELRQKPELALEVLSVMVANGEAVKTSAYCYVHQRECHMIPG